MSWVLTVVSGSRQGDTFPIRDGLSIGRKDADVALDDRRVSGLHAFVRGRGEGGWILHDNGSKNGVKDARGNPVTSLNLGPKSTFTVGETTFRVDLLEQRAPVRTTPPAPEPAPARAPVAPAESRRTWYDVLANFLTDHAPEFVDQPRPLVPFEPALVLDFVRGPQVSAKWILGYGPRRVGPAALDLPLWDAELPPVCFEIVPSKDGLIFRTEHRELVRLNGRPVDSDVLRMGDTIHIRETLIEVDFTE